MNRILKPLAILALLALCGASNPANIPAVNTVAALKAIPATAGPVYATVQVNGYAASGDFGPPETFVWSAGSSATDDACTVINPTGNGGNGRYLLVYGQELEAKACGAKEDGATNDYPALTAAIAALNAKASSTTPVTLRIDFGVSAIASATSSPLKPNPYFTIRCRNQVGAGFLVTGASVMGPTVEFDNPQSNWIYTCRFGGNNTADGTDSSTARAVFFDAKAGAPVTQFFGVFDSSFDNYAGTYWIDVRNDGSNIMQNIRISGNKFTTFSGNDPNPTNIAHPADLIAVQGEQNNLGGSVNDVIVEKNFADGTWIKRCTTIWAGVFRVKIINNTFQNCAANTGADAGPYSILTYHNDPSSIGTDLPSNILIEGNSVIGINGNGVYCASCKDERVAHNYFSDQNNSTFTVIPHFAVAFNGGSGSMAITNNIFSNNLQNIYVSGTSGSITTIANNIITSTKNSAFGMQLTGSASASDNTTQTILQGNSLNLSGTSTVGVTFFSDTGVNPGSLKIVGDSYSVTSVCLQLYDNTSTNLVNIRTYIGGGTLCTGAIGAAAYAMRLGSVSPLEINGLTIDGVNFNASANGILLSNSTKVRINDVTLMNNASGSGVMWQAVNTVGSLSNLQFFNVGASETAAANSLGTLKPTSAGYQGEFVQNISSSFACSAAISVIGWGWDTGTTWTTREAGCH